MKRSLFIIVMAVTVTATAVGQQVADNDYSPVIKNPMYTQGKGPVVFIDEGHFNFHTKSNRYLPFARLLKSDGYTCFGYAGEFETKRLNEGRILVIANALNEANEERWYKPVLPAFTSKEVEVVRRWVETGGSLFLIADHMPMGGAAKEMAAAFGFTFTDGFAIDTTASGPAFFYRADHTLSDNIITNGRNQSEQIDSIVSFTGQAFPVPEDASSVLIFDNRYTLLLSDTAWVFNRNTQRKNINGWSQLAYKKYGMGRVVVSGEAAMFTAQIAGPQKAKVGMNSPYAKRNYQLLLNIIHWLDGKLD